MSEAGESGSGRPSEKAVVKALRRLPRHGVEIPWVRETAGVLFELSCVQERADKEFKGEPDALSLALIAILREKVEAMRRVEHRKILSIVLDLDQQYPETSASTRRKIAGEQFRDGKRVVTQGTIRQYHEPAAIKQLGHLLLATERDAQTA